MVAAEPENDTPEDEAVGTDTGDAFVSVELAMTELDPDKTPPGPNVIPLVDDEAAAEVFDAL